MDQQKGWAVPLLLAVGASCYTAVQSLSVRKKRGADAPAGGTAGGKRRSVMENPYNRRASGGKASPIPEGADAVATKVTPSPRPAIVSPRNGASPRSPRGGFDASTSASTSEAGRVASNAGSHANGASAGKASPAPSSVSGSSRRCPTPSAALVSYFNPNDNREEAFYSSAPMDATAMTSFGIRGAYQVRLGPLRVIVRPDFILEADDYHFPLQCFRYRHADGSLLTLMAEECTAARWPLTTAEYTARNVEATREVAEQNKTYFKVKINVRASDVVTTVMGTYVNLHIGPGPVVVASFFLVHGSLALTIQLQAHTEQYRDRMPDLFATVQNAKLDDMSSRQFSMVSRGGLCTHALRGPTFSYLLTLPTSLSINIVECSERSLEEHTDAAGNVTVARIIHNVAPRWEARVVSRPQSKWRLVRWLKQAQTLRGTHHADPLTNDPYEFSLVPEMASLVLDQETITDLVGVTGMIEALRASGGLYMEVTPTASAVPSQKFIAWAPPHSESGESSSVTSASLTATEDWLTPSTYFPRYESTYWSIPLPSPQHFEAKLCEHAGDNAITLFIKPLHTGPEELFEVEPMLLHCGCATVSADNATDENTDICVDHFISRSGVLFTEPAEPSVFLNHGGETCVVLEGLSSLRPECVVRIAAIHVYDRGNGQHSAARGPKHRGTDGTVDYWIVYRWIFHEDLVVSRELRQYENHLLQSGRPC